MGSQKNTKERVMKIKTVGRFMMDLMAVVVSGVIAIISRSVNPAASGVAAAICVCLATLLIINQKYEGEGYKMPKHLALKWGLWPLALILVTTLLLIYGISSTSFWKSFFSVVLFAVSFMLGTFVIQAQK